MHKNNSNAGYSEGRTRIHVLQKKMQRAPGIFPILIFQTAIFICLSNFSRMPEKCLIIFAFHIEKWNAAAAGKRGPRHIYITDISFKKCVRTRTGHHIFIFSVDCHCFNCRQKIDVIFKFNETKRSDKK